MPEQKTMRGSVFYWFVTWLFLFALCGALWLIWTQSQENEALCMEEKERLEAKKQALESDLQFVQELLTLPPCEARTRWESHTFKQ
mgnify:CR=1 FL=1